jgi:hypothetical protein
VCFLVPLFSGSSARLDENHRDTLGRWLHVSLGRGEDSGETERLALLVLREKTLVSLSSSGSRDSSRRLCLWLMRPSGLAQRVANL